jgi:hypothetical protein
MCTICYRRIVPIQSGAILILAPATGLRKRCRIRYGVSTGRRP